MFSRQNLSAYVRICLDICVKMASAKKRWTTEEVLSYMGCDDSSNDEAPALEETYTEYIGVYLDEEEGSVDSMDIVSGDDKGEYSAEGESANSKDEDSEEVQTSNSTISEDLEETDEGCSEDLVQQFELSIQNNTVSSDTSDPHEDILVESETDVSENDVTPTITVPEPNSSTDESSEEEESPPCSDGDSSSQQRPTERQQGRGRRGQGRGRGRGRGRRRIQSRQRQWQDTSMIPAEAKNISQEDEDFHDWNSEFTPNRCSGPHIPDDCKSELDILQLFLPDSILDNFIRATNDYAELKRREKRLMYMRFKRTALTQGEMLRYIGVLILLSINNTRNYRKAWERKNPQVRIYAISFSL